MLAYDNPKKTDSRQLIAEVIEEYLEDQQIRMFELLGGGVGAHYYANNLDINTMVLVEQNSDLYRKFDPYYLKCDSVMYNCSAQKYFKTKYPKTGYGKQFFNVINLDFCSWFYDNGKVSCTSKIIEQMFQSEALCDGGLLFFTFQIDGFNLDLFKVNTGKTVPLTPDEIALEIQFLAMNNGYEIAERNYIFHNTYSSASYCRGHKMLNIGFKMKKN